MFNSTDMIVSSSRAFLKTVITVWVQWSVCLYSEADFEASLITRVLSTADTSSHVLSQKVIVAVKG